MKEIIIDKSVWEFFSMFLGGILAIVGAAIGSVLGALLTIVGLLLILVSSTLFYIDSYRSKFHKEVPYE